MRKLAFAALLPLAACGNFGNNDDPGIAATGSGSSRSYAVTDFTAVDLTGSDDVEVRVGAAFSVRAEGDSKVLERLRITRDGDTLSIGRRSHSGISWGDSGKVKVYVTMPRITGADVSGSGDLAVDRVEGARFAGSIAGSGGLTLAALAVDTAKLDIAGSGNITAAGTAKALEVSIAGSGDVDAARLVARGASVSVAGSGDVTAVVEGDAKVEVMGSGDVDLGPKARCTVDKMGSGKVTCG